MRTHDGPPIVSAHTRRSCSLPLDLARIGRLNPAKVDRRAGGVEVGLCYVGAEHVGAGWGCLIVRQLIAKRDRSSVQYMTASDRDLWIRVQRPIGSELRISHFQTGSLDAAEIDEVLVHVLIQHAEETLRTITVENLGSTAGHDTDRRELVRRFDVLSRAVRRWAVNTGRTMENARLDIRGGIYSAVFDVR